MMRQEWTRAAFLPATRANAALIALPSFGAVRVHSLSAPFLIAARSALAPGTTRIASLPLVFIRARMDWSVGMVNCEAGSAPL